MVKQYYATLTNKAAQRLGKGWDITGTWTLETRANDEGIVMFIEIVRFTEKFNWWPFNKSKTYICEIEMVHEDDIVFIHQMTNTIQCDMRNPNE